jgi:lipoprotein-anchoring transpeptidase ErfK/SrfK
MSRISALRAFALAAFAGAAFTATASANPLVLGYAPQDTRSVETMTEPNEGFQQVARFKRQIVSYYTTEAPGTIIIDTPSTYLYLVLGNGRAMRYGIGVGREGFTWSGTQTITKKAEWPDWHPPQEMIERQPYLPRFMAGGPGNPLGARAMYLGGTVYRIHGTNAPDTIGHQVSSGCIRLINEDVTDLYSRVNVGTKVVVLPMTGRNTASRVSALH